MRVYFFPKWLIQAVLIGLCALLAAGVLWSFLGGDDPLNPSLIRGIYPCIRIG